MKIIAKIYYIPISKRKTWKHPPKDWIWEVDCTVINYCCEEMKFAWEDCFIGFGEFDRTLNTNEDVNIYSCHSYPGGTCWDELAINYCPFCAKKIVIEKKDMPRRK